MPSPVITYFSKSKTAPAMTAVFISACIVSGFAEKMSGFEAHVINVTAHVCSSSQIRSMGFWKTHSEIYKPLLPQNLGDEIIGTHKNVQTIFKNYGGSSMRDKVKGQLLALKFNLAYFNVGSYFDETTGKNIYQIISEADSALLQKPPMCSKELEKIKNTLERLNTMETIRMCSAGSIISGQNTMIQEPQPENLQVQTQSSTTTESVPSNTPSPTPQPQSTTSQPEPLTTSTPQLPEQGTSTPAEPAATTTEPVTTPAENTTNTPVQETPVPVLPPQPEPANTPLPEPQPASDPVTSLSPAPETPPAPESPPPQPANPEPSQPVENPS